MVIGGASYNTLRMSKWGDFEGGDESDSQNDSDNTKSTRKNIRITTSMIAFKDYFNDQPHPSSSASSEHLLGSDCSIFPFPKEAARSLADLRSDRFDSSDLAIEEAQMRIREFASMMGLSTLHDDPPSAA